MIFGSKSDFAIQAIIEPDLELPSHPWGRLCIWVDNTPIGDFDDPHCGLYNCYESFTEKCEELNDLWRDEFNGLSDTQMWNLLDGALYDYHGNKALDRDRDLAEISKDSDTYFKFNFLTNWGEMFDGGGKSFVFKLPTGEVKILNFDRNKEVVNSYLCTELSFRRACKEFAAWYENQLAKLGDGNA